MLADAFMADAACVSRAAERFAFDFGVVLQLVDDIQVAQLFKVF